VANTFVLDMPVELGLEFVPVISSNSFDAEGEFADDVIDEGDGVGLIVPLKDFEGPDASGIINGGVLVALDRLVVFVIECQELDISLDLTARNLTLTSDGMNFAQPGPSWKAVEAIAFEDAVDASV
jgi:hypothetical protein